MLPSFQRTKNQLNPTDGCGDRSVLKFSEILRTNDESAIFFSSFSRIPENFGGNIIQNCGGRKFEKFALYYFSNFGFWKYGKNGNFLKKISKSPWMTALARRIEWSHSQPLDRSRTKVTVIFRLENLKIVITFVLERSRG